MLNVTRESILSAVFTRLSGATFARPVTGKTGFAISSRRLKLWSDVAKTDRPSMFMTCHHEVSSYKSENTPAVLQFQLRIFIYLDSSDTSIAPDSDISVILDAIDAALNPGPAEQRLTLAGVVSHCRIDGDVLRDPGDLDNDGLIIIPISIVTT